MGKSGERKKNTPHGVELPANQHSLFAPPGSTRYELAILVGW